MAIIEAERVWEREQKTINAHQGVVGIERNSTVLLCSKVSTALKPLKTGWMLFDKKKSIFEEKECCMSVYIYITYQLSQI